MNDLPRLKNVSRPENWCDEKDGEWRAPVDWDALRKSYSKLPPRGAPDERKHRSLSVQATLEWAFADEGASLDYGDLSIGGGLADSCARLMQQGNLGGVRIDTSPGRSLPADGAQAVACAVAATFADRGQAVEIARFAKARRCPDWGEGRRLEVVPKRWEPGREGRQSIVLSSWQHLKTRGGVQRCRVSVCPVRIANDASTIGELRRNYNSWRMALLWLRPALQALDLKWISVTDELPPQRPWAGSARKSLTKGSS
ncbi:hypothetical protein [Tateyamaria sp. syn59]|uniref:hypothetical protein n=1 Tax=Tateyamaria sp. syn59 TaxID=2576942 RepID=UPI0011BFE4F3|nr:hypothetical protein [Tateyamaria sp. syn59]